MWHILVHGGAAPLEVTDLTADRSALRAALSVGSEMLRRGAHALDVVEATVRSLEDSARFIAGKGACPNELGRWELDACICDGATHRVGAVACLEGYSHPISVARFVMERTKNVLLTGVGAARFAQCHGFDEVTDPHSFFVPSNARAVS
jgi:beta-aspartyl-peptidase (threonine type)